MDTDTYSPKAETVKSVGEPCIDMSTMLNLNANSSTVKDVIFSNNGI